MEIASKLNLFQLSQLMPVNSFFNQIATSEVKRRLKYAQVEVICTHTVSVEPKFSGILGIIARYGEKVDRIRESNPEFQAEGEQLLVLPKSDTNYVGGGFSQNERLRIDTLLASDIICCDQIKKRFIKPIARLGLYFVAMSLVDTVRVCKCIYYQKILCVMVEQQASLSELINAYKSRPEWHNLANVVHMLWERDRLQDAIKLAKTFSAYPFNGSMSTYHGVSSLSYVNTRLVSLGGIDQAKELVNLMLNTCSDYNSEDQSERELIVRAQMQIVAALSLRGNVESAKRYFESMDLSRVVSWEANQLPRCSIEYGITKNLIKKPLDVFLSHVDEIEELRYRECFDSNLKSDTPLL